MKEQIEKLERWAPGNDGMFKRANGAYLLRSETLASIAAQEPKQAMTDAEIGSLMLAAFPRTKCSQVYIAFAHAIERAVSPNKELVEALQELCDLVRLDVADGEHTTEFTRGIAALRAAGVEAA